MDVNQNRFQLVASGFRQVGRVDVEGEAVLRPDHDGLVELVELHARGAVDAAVPDTVPRLLVNWRLLSKKVVCSILFSSEVFLYVLVNQFWFLSYHRCRFWLQ